MDNFLNYIKMGVAAIGTIFTFIFGAWDTALIVLISFMVLDYMTGLIKAYVSNTVSSDTGLKGIARKSLIFVVLIVAVLLDRLLNNGTWVFRTLVCYFYVCNEAISILENCGELGLPIPEKLRETLEQLKTKDEDIKEEI